MDLIHYLFPVDKDPFYPCLYIQRVPVKDSQVCILTRLNTANPAINSEDDGRIYGDGLQGFLLRHTGLDCQGSIDRQVLCGYYRMITHYGYPHSSPGQYTWCAETLVSQLHLGLTAQGRADNSRKSGTGNLFSYLMSLSTMFQSNLYIKLPGNPDDSHDIISPVGMGLQGQFLLQDRYEALHLQVSFEVFSLLLHKLLL